MSIPTGNDNGSGKSGVKTFALRLEPEPHAQLSVIAQLRGTTITDEVRTAIDAHIALARTAPELVDGATNALDEIERDAAVRRAAIATLFGEVSKPDDEPSPATPKAAPATTRKGPQR